MLPEPHKHYEKAKTCETGRWAPQSESVHYATGEEQRAITNSSRKNETAVPKDNNIKNATTKLKSVIPWKENYDEPRYHVKKQRHQFAIKGLYSQSYSLAGRNINNLIYTGDTTLMAKSKEELRSLLMKVKEVREKTEYSKNKDHGSRPHHFMANVSGNNGNSDRL